MSRVEYVCSSCDVRIVEHVPDGAVECPVCALPEPSGSSDLDVRLSVIAAESRGRF